MQERAREVFTEPAVAFMSSYVHMLPCAPSARLWCCIPASGMSHRRADGRRASGCAVRGTVDGGVSLMNAQAARSMAPSRTGCQPVRGCGNAQASRSTAARSASGSYHAAVAGRPPYRAGGRVSSRAVRIRFSGNNAIVMPQILSKYVRSCYIIHMVLCNRMGVDCIRYCNLNALFDIMVGKGETNG